jgi:hypothetical protein
MESLQPEESRLQHRDDAADLCGRGHAFHDTAQPAGDPSCDRHNAGHMGAVRPPWRNTIDSPAAVPPTVGTAMAKAMRDMRIAWSWWPSCCTGAMAFK